MTLTLLNPEFQVNATASSGSHPILRMIARRLGLGVITVWVVTLVVYWATMVLPGDAATAILGQSATPERLAALTRALHLDESPVSAYWHWVTGILSGDPGISLVNGQEVVSLAFPRILNSAVLVIVATLLSTLIGISLGVVLARRRDTVFDHATSGVTLAASALPEFIVAIFVILLLSVKVFHWFPSVSTLNPGEHIWNEPSKMMLPVLTLLIVVTPYAIRMMRAAMIEALNTEYVELAELKGLTSRRILLRHAMPNALAPTIAVIGLNILYLAGGIVLVETVFNYPGLGQELVDSVNNRDVPVIQFLVLFLAVFYVVLNILIDLVVLLITPRRRVSR
ncbi:MAG: ABC transporter permease subunit [Actinobacteria bacterium]|uniref:Unannotated protein n=1 Tax=freshwater metagenome TaxID=449393 RepID=A0A6J7JK26_9ZZZZ|nr:ABC transporter permease subunit [Actinomycetota bacterium]